MRVMFLLITALLTVSTASIAAEKKDLPSKASDKKASAKKPDDKKAEEIAKPLPKATDIMTQRDFAHELIKVLGWEGGLSSKPSDRDYLVILEGKRTMKFEAESVYNMKTDAVSPRKFGSFSGDSWLGGPSSPTTVHMKVFIPISGDYNFIVAANGIGQKWKLAGKEFMVSSSSITVPTTVANVALKAGELEIEMLMPPQGALDYLLFNAKDFSPIEPLEGWRFNEKLTNADIATITASLLGLEDKLPNDAGLPSIQIIASEMKSLPSTVQATDLSYMGPFTGKKWIRAFSSGADLDIPFSVPANAVYSIKARVMGDDGFSVSVDGTQVEREKSPALSWVNFGLHRLGAGNHNFHIKLPVYGGIDALVIESKQSSPGAYMDLTGIKGDPKAEVTYADMQKVLNGLSERFKSRR